MRSYVDGREELARPLTLVPLGTGRVSLGSRINRVSWFKGAIREVRFTPRALAAGELQGAGAAPR